MVLHGFEMSGFGNISFKRLETCKVNECYYFSAVVLYENGCKNVICSSSAVFFSSKKYILMNMKAVCN